MNDVSASGTSASATPIRSIALMVMASGLLTLNDAIVKWLAQSYPVGQVITLRG